MSDYLHNHKNFRELIRIVGAELNIEPGLLKKTIGLCMCYMG